MWDHNNKVKALVDELGCLEVPMRNKDIVMICLRVCHPCTMLNHRFGNQTNDEVDCGVRDGMFDIQDVQEK